MICLDTNAIIMAINDRGSPVRSRIDAAVKAGIEITLSTVVLYELQYGVAKSRHREHNERRLDSFLAGPFGILAFEPDDAREAGDIRAALERAGTPIGPYDILIAAQARRQGAMLATANMREFSRVPGLNLQDWSAPVFPR